MSSRKRDNQLFSLRSMQLSGFGDYGVDIGRPTTQPVSPSSRRGAWRRKPAAERLGRRSIKQARTTSALGLLDATASVGKLLKLAATRAPMQTTHSDAGRALTP